MYVCTTHTGFTIIYTHVISETKPCTNHREAPSQGSLALRPDARTRRGRAAAPSPTYRCRALSESSKKRYLRGVRPTPMVSPAPAFLPRQISFLSRLGFAEARDDAKLKNTVVVGGPMGHNPPLDDNADATFTLYRTHIDVGAVDSDEIHLSHARYRQQKANELFERTMGMASKQGATTTTASAAVVSSTMARTKLQGTKTKMPLPPRPAAWPISSARRRREAAAPVVTVQQSPFRRAANLAHRTIAKTSRAANHAVSSTPLRRAAYVLSPGRRKRSQPQDSRWAQAACARGGGGADAHGAHTDDLGAHSCNAALGGHAARIADPPTKRAAMAERPRATKRTAKGAGTGRGTGRATTRFASARASTDPGRDLLQYGFEPLGPIAAGAFSTIRRARSVGDHPRLSRGLEVAVKTWPHSACDKAPEQAMIRDGEIATLKHSSAQLHPHVANLLDVLVGPIAIHAILEYCSGGSLQRHLQRLQTTKQAKRKPSTSSRTSPHGAVPEMQARLVTGQVASALGHLHALGIAHRDVKPANVRGILCTLRNSALARAHAFTVVISTTSSIPWRVYRLQRLR